MKETWNEVIKTSNEESNVCALCYQYKLQLILQ
jgi:hypothetical protein